MVNLTKTAALELRPAGIRVNAILLGFAETELVTANRDDFTAALDVDIEPLLSPARNGAIGTAFRRAFETSREVMRCLKRQVAKRLRRTRRCLPHHPMPT